jgi:hypothetical protein
MLKLVRIAATGSLAVAAALTLTAAPAMAAGPSDYHKGYTCAGGTIGSGHYDSITVTGMCSVAMDAVIKIDGKLVVKAGAMLDAQSAPSTIWVDGDVMAGRGSFLGLGCQPDFPHNTGHPCAAAPAGHSMITVKGDVSAWGANTVLLNGITVKGDVSLMGGGGNIPWSIKNNTIKGSLTARDQVTDWLGVLFNSVGKNVTLTNITVTDPGDPGRLVFVVRNTIGRNLSCSGLMPGVSGGFFPGEVNIVGRHAIGQCASLV